MSRFREVECKLGVVGLLLRRGFLLLIMFLLKKIYLGFRKSCIKGVFVKDMRWGGVYNEIWS